jgi:hypothetical protein
MMDGFPNPVAAGGPGPLPRLVAVSGRTAASGHEDRRSGAL